MKYNMQLNGYIHTHITEHLLAPFNEIIPELIRIFQSSLPSTSQFGKIACISIPFVFHIALLNVENFSTLILNNISLVSKLLSFNLYDKNLNTLCLKRHFFYYTLLHNSNLGYVSDERALLFYKTAGPRTNEWGFPFWDN